MDSNKRILKEIKDFSLENVKLFVYKFNMFKVTAEFIGPEYSLYENIPIKLDFYYTINYPFKPPSIYFNPPIFHPNVSLNGFLKVDSLTGDYWSPALTLNSLIPTIQNLLYEPFICENSVIDDKGKDEVEDMEEIFEECANPEAFRIWKSDPEQFRQIVLSMLN